MFSRINKIDDDSYGTIRERTGSNLKEIKCPVCKKKSLVYRITNLPSQEGNTCMIVCKSGLDIYGGILFHFRTILSYEMRTIAESKVMHLRGKTFRL